MSDDSEQSDSNRSSSSEGVSLVSVNVSNDDIKISKEFACHDYWRQFSAGLYKAQYHVSWNNKVKSIKLPSLFKDQDKNTYDLLYQSLRQVTQQANEGQKPQVLKPKNELYNYKQVKVQTQQKLMSRKKADIIKKKIIFYRQPEQKGDSNEFKQKNSFDIEEDLNGKYSQLSKMAKEAERSSSADQRQAEFYSRIGINKWDQDLSLLVKDSIQKQMKQIMEYKNDDPLKNLLELNRELSNSRQKRFREQHKNLMFAQYKALNKSVRFKLTDDQK